MVPTISSSDQEPGNPTNQPSETQSPAGDRGNTLAPSFGDTTFPTISQNETSVPTSAGSNSNSTLAPSSETLFPTVPMNGTANSTIEEFLFQTLTDDGSLATDGSPQSRALGAILETTPELDPSVPEDQTEILQRYALNTLYFSTNGPSWISNELWASASHPCGGEGDSTWFGVECNAGLTVIERLSLPTNDLLGILPSEIRGLVGLKYLNLFSNQLSGVIPNGIGELTLLTALEAGMNFFTSSLPPEIGNLNSLNVLTLFSNLISGNIPAEMGQLQALQTLNLQENFLTGNIPVEFFGLANLGKLAVRIEWRFLRVCPCLLLMCLPCVSYIDVKLTSLFVQCH
jgi:hypothetical protein